MKCSHRLRKELLTAGFFLFCGASLLHGGQLLDEAKLEQYVDHALTVFDVPGCAVGVVKDAEIVFTGGYGLADVDNGRKVDVATQFKVQSVAKTFTASAVMQLVERDLIRLDDPVAKHVPYFRLADERFKGVTVRMLLNHTSGVPTMYKAEFGFEDPEYDEGALRRHVESLEKKPMLSDPGAEYHYSNNGYAILAALIESVSGMSFEKYMRTRVLDPVGMQRSGFSMSEIDEENLASAHILGEDLNPAVCPYRPYNRWAASCGGLYSSIEDMSRWALASINKGHTKNRILKETSYDKMWTVVSEANGRVGLGWFLDDLPVGRLVSHPGGGLGYSSELCLFPEEDLAIVVLCNARRSPTWEIVMAVYRFMHGKEPAPITAGLETELLNRIKQEGVDAAVRYYRELRAEHPEGDFSPTELLVLGHRLLISEHPEKARMATAILELAVEHYPDEASAYDFLAEAYLELALENYRKATSLDPTNWGAREISAAIDSATN